MKTFFLSFLCMIVLAHRVHAQGALSCEVPPLSEADFKTAVGPAAVKFNRTRDDGKSCLYVHPGGSSIQITLRSSGNYAVDEYNAKKEEDDQKAKSPMPMVEGVSMDIFKLPKPEAIPTLGAMAYKMGDRSDVVVNVLDESKMNYFDVEIKLQDLRLSSVAAAKKLARSIEANFTQKDQQNRIQPSGPMRPTLACEEKLSADDIQRITGLKPAQYEFKLGSDESCSYDAKVSDHAHRLFQFSALKPETQKEANSILNTLRNHSLDQKISGFGVAAGIMASNKIWFVSTNRKWIVTVGYYEISSRDSEQQSYSQSEKDGIRDNLAWTIDKNLSGSSNPAPQQEDPAH